MAKYNDIDMKHWKEYDDILTDTLWMFDKRDNSGVHSANSVSYTHLTLPTKRIV